MSAAEDFAATIDALRDQPLVVLAEMQFAYESGGAVANGTVYLADGVYATEASETPASTSYIDAIAALPDFSRALDPRTLMGGATYSVGSLELDNADGRLDGLLDLIVDGWPCEFYLGLPTWRRNQFIHALSAVVERISAPGPDRLVVALRDPGYLLDKRISGEAIGGSTSNANRRKPIVVGTPQQVDGLLGDTTNLRYWIGTGIHPYAVRDHGVSLVSGYPSASGTNAVITADAGTDTISIAGHGFQNEQVVTITTSGTVFAGMTAGAQYWIRNRAVGTFQLSATRTGSILDITGTSFSGTMVIIARGYYLNGDGSIDVSNTPAGRITVDHTDPVTGGSTLSVPGALQRVALTHAGLEPSRWGGAHASYDPSSWGGVDGAVGYLISEPENAVEVLDRIAESFSSWWAFTRAGALTYGALWSTADASVMDLTADDVVPRSAFSVERMPVSYGAFRLIYQRNWTRQTDLASGVSPANVALWTGPGFSWEAGTPSGTAYATNPQAYHLTMNESPEFDTVLAAEDFTTASFFMPTALDARLDLLRPHIDIVRMDTTLGKAGLEIGDKVTFDDVFPAGLSTLTARVIGIDVSLTNRRVTLSLMVRRTPQTASGTFYG